MFNNYFRWGLVAHIFIKSWGFDVCFVDKYFPTIIYHNLFLFGNNKWNNDVMQNLHSDRLRAKKSIRHYRLKNFPIKPYPNNRMLIDQLKVKLSLMNIYDTLNEIITIKNQKQQIEQIKALQLQLFKYKK